MKAVITITLANPTRFGNTKIKKVIYARKEHLISEVNNFIYIRQNHECFIKAVEFCVKCYDYKMRVSKSWSYKPTYI